MKRLILQVSIISLAYYANTHSTIIEITNNLDETLIAYDPYSINGEIMATNLKYALHHYKIHPGDIVQFKDFFGNNKPLLRANRANWWILRIQYNEPIDRWMLYFWHPNKDQIPLLAKTITCSQHPIGVQSLSLEDNDQAKDPEYLYTYTPFMSRKVLKTTNK